MKTATGSRSLPLDRIFYFQPGKFTLSACFSSVHKITQTLSENNNKTNKQIPPPPISPPPPPPPKKRHIKTTKVTDWSRAKNKNKKSVLHQNNEPTSNNEVASLHPLSHVAAHKLYAYSRHENRRERRY